MDDPTAGLLATLEQEAAKVPEVVATAKKPRQRNYRQMKDEKLLRCRAEMLSQGDAYSRCVHGGSGDPVADLAQINALIRQRGLS